MPTQMLASVSIIIPARNRHNLLLRAIGSARAQAEINNEIIVVDDASNPPLEGFLRKNGCENIWIHRNQERRNASFCRNRGAELARYPYLAFLDSDDTWFPYHLKTALGHLPDPAAAVLYVSGHGREQSVGHAEPTTCFDGYSLIFDRVRDPRSSVLVCGKSLFLKTGGFDESLEKYQDWDFALRCAKEGAILLPDATTVSLDEDAEGRMSARANLAAARRFLSKHSDNMSKAHLVRFFATLLRVAGSGQKSDRKDAIVLVREYLSLRDFPLRYWPIRLAPRLSPYAVRGWLVLKRLRTIVR